MRDAFRIILAIMALCWTGFAAAAEWALAEAIGYSPDGRYFAFEEFGIQDGSGFAYSTIYVIDLPEDRWVLGTPVRIVAEDETVDLAAIRSRARTQGQAFVGSLGITVPAHLLAANGDGAPDADGRALAFGLPFPASGEPVAVEYTLQLSTFVSTSTLTCNDWFGVPPRGFALSIENFGTAREVHRDAALPRSRGCPADYRISAVYAPFQAGDISGAVALVSVFIGGFEGRDRRFVAVPLAAAAGRF